MGCYLRAAEENAALLSVIAYEVRLIELVVIPARLEPRVSTLMASRAMELLGYLSKLLLFVLLLMILVQKS